MSLYKDISVALQAGETKTVSNLVQQAVDSGMPVKEILEEGLLKGMDYVSARFKNHKIFITQIILAASAMTEGINVLRPHMVSSGVETFGRACIGTMLGDMHDIGKDLVRIMLQSKGFDVIDLGNNVAPRVFYETAVEKKCALVCASTLLTTTMLSMREMVDIFVEKGYRDKVKIMVGGAPVNQRYCDDIKADGYAPDATSAAELAFSYFKNGFMNGK